MRRYGTCIRLDGAWVMKTEAQVAIRAKRVFPKIHAKASVLTLIDTVENCCELQWFLERYPMTISADDSAHMFCRAKGFVNYLEKIGKLAGEEPERHNHQMAKPPRDYQWQATNMARHVHGLICADDVGTGKTVVGIALTSFSECLPALVVTLTHLPTQWRDKYAEFLPSATTFIPKKATAPKDFQLTADVVIMNYHKMHGWAAALAGKVKTVIFDEAHELRNNDTNRYQAAALIAEGAAYRLGLTATPIFNYGSEMCNVANIMRPGALGSNAEFRQEWCGSPYSDSIQEPRAFGEYMREIGLMIRRTRRDVGRELPPVTLVPHTVDVDPGHFDSVAADATVLAQRMLSGEGTGIERMQTASELDWKLREATGIAKAPIVAGLVRMLVESGEKVLVGAWHHAVYDILMHELQDLRPLKFTGQESPTQKAAALEAFTNGICNVLLMSNRAGAGVDGIQHACSVVVYAELDWSPAVHEQFTGRVARDGQKDPVLVYYVIATSGADPTMSDTLGVKRGQLEGIRNLEDLPQQVDPDRIKRLAEEFLKQRSAKK